MARLTATQATLRVRARIARLPCRATFGDFLHQAHHHLESGNDAGRTVALEDLEQVIGALSRLVTVMGRYTRDLTATLPELGPQAQPVLSPWAEACFQAHEALAAAARFVALQVRPHGPVTAVSVGSQTRRLIEAARWLRMGRDLLHTHFAPGAEGGRRHRSEWALVVTSDAVRRALLGEIASFARTAADQCSELALSRHAGVSGDGQARRRLNAACQWLWVLDASVRTAQQRRPSGTIGAEVLSAIPVNTLPPRHVLRGGEPVAALCEGAISSAERVGHLAWLAAEHTPASRNVTTASLRQVAENSTVTSHNCAALLDVLAIRMDQAGHRDASSWLVQAAETARQARDDWLSAARGVVRVRTVTPGAASPVAVEAGELASWTGRLAYADPQWSPSDGPDRPLRRPETMAAEDVPQMVAAAHHTCQTLEGLAHAEHDQTRAAAQAGRILVPTRSLPEEYDIPYPFARAPQERVEELLVRYAQAGQASRRAAEAVGLVAETLQAPSRTLTRTRSAVAEHADRLPDVPVPGPGRIAEADDSARTPAEPGPVETTLLDLGITDSGLLAQSAEIDRHAERLIIDAAVRAEARQRPHLPTGLSRSAGTAALVNHALKSGDSRATALLRLTARAQREPPEREP
jgi:hypothetical protein